jgi:hypothetical protein
MGRRIQQRIDLFDGHLRLRPTQLDDLVASAHVAFLQDTQIEPRASAGGQQGRHARLVHANAKAIAGYARLRDFKYRMTYLVDISDTYLMVRQSIDRKVLAELSKAEFLPVQKRLPVSIGIDLIGQHGALFSAMSAKIPLAVTVKAQTPSDTSPLHRKFPASRMHGPPIPFDVAREANIHR